MYDNTNSGLRRVSWVSDVPRWLWQAEQTTSVRTIPWDMSLIPETAPHQTVKQDQGNQSHDNGWNKGARLGQSVCFWETWNIMMMSADSGLEDMLQPETLHWARIADE